MYLARSIGPGPVRFSLRQSYRSGDAYRHRTLVDLGRDPSRFIVYPGGKGYYYDQRLLDALEAAGAPAQSELLDRIFFPFLDPEIQRVITAFDRSWNRPAPRQLDHGAGAETVHPFDKRRWHFLRFGKMDQRGIDTLPEKLFARFCACSRDEIEQHFLGQELRLTPYQQAAYVFTIFQVGEYVTHPHNRPDPSRINQQDLDRFFIRRLCDLNDDAAFWAGMEPCDRLRPYLVRYAVIFFDTSLPRFRRPAWMDEVEDFINRHRRYRPPRSVRTKMAEAEKLFGMPWKQLRRMDRSELSRLYRRLAMEHHPDHGGDEAAFRRLTEVYQALSARKR